MANIRQRRRFPVAGAYEGTLPGAEFHLITSVWLNSDQVGCRCVTLPHPPMGCFQCREDGRTSALKTIGHKRGHLPRWTHVRRVVGRREGNGCIRYDWYGFHEGWRA